MKSTIDLFEPYAGSQSIKAVVSASGSDLLRDSMGRYRTRSLFLETRNLENPSLVPLYTLKERDYKGCLSFRRKYLEIGDLTEYRQATELLGSWEHWQLLQECNWFKPHLEEWREELRIKLRSEHLEKLRATARSGGKNEYEATKFLYAITSNEEKTSKRGRPSKEEVARNVKWALEETETIETDLSRIGLGELE